MHHWTKRLLALASPLLLAGCLWGPGKFTSDLALKKDGSFVLDYRGQMLLQLPPDEASRDPWKAEMAKCFEGMENRSRPQAVVIEPGTTSPKERECTADEIAAQKSDYEQNKSTNRNESEDMAKLFGMPGLDDDSNRAFASKLMKYAGWRSVTYRGKGVFDVDYHLEGRLTQDFVFPLMPESNIVVPFIAIRRRTDGAVLVTAPALTGGMNMFGPMPKQMSGDMSGPPSRAEGRFTVHTDGQIMTNNSEDGPVSDPLGGQIHWDISPIGTKVPETLVQL